MAHQGSYIAHGTHTTAAAIIKSVNVATTSNSTAKVTIVGTGRHNNLDENANTVSKQSFTASATVGSHKSSTYKYPTAAISVPAGKGKKVDGNNVNITMSVQRTSTEQTLTVTFSLKSNISSKTSSATQSVTIPAARYALTVDPNGGSWDGKTTVSTISQENATTTSIAAPTRAGYVFVGWAETGPGHLSKINNTDPAFDSSSGGVAVYNNSGGDTVTHTRQSSSAGTPYGDYEILINATSGTTSPGNGGFYQPTTSAANQKYIHAFVAKIPIGYTVQHAQNATGDGRTIQWLTSRRGTGDYQIYAYQHNCGSSGTFSTFGHVYLDTGSRPVSWQLAYSGMTNITDGFADTYTYGAGPGRLTALWAPNIPMHVNIDGTWKTGPVWLNINGTWKPALKGYINVNGTWKQIK